MFIVKPKSAKDLQEALFICSYYHVVIESFSNGSDPESVELQIEEYKNYIDDPYEQYRLCEMAFQMNFHQDGSKRICDVCRRKLEETGEGEASCGHLTFTERRQL